MQIRLLKELGFDKGNLKEFLYDAVLTDVSMFIILTYFEGRDNSCTDDQVIL